MQSNSKFNGTLSTSIDNKVFDKDMLKTILKNDIEKRADPERLDKIKNLIKTGQYNIPSMHIAESIISGKNLLNKED